jgi:eukaryotic-like serine/threonine-protein kinase
MARMALTAGSKLGPYEIVCALGAGGMGVVYKARDLKLERTVALKLLPEEVSGAPQNKKQFLKEARIASLLDHPNIGTIHGMEETADGRTFIVMAFYEGLSLATRLAGRPIPPAEVANIASQVAAGLSEAHSKNVVHRDIKPSNVMITKQGVVKIVDFGIARVMPQTATLTQGTTGTIGYMSPEQALGREVDQRTDIWSLGVVMAEALTGRNPYQRETVPGTMFAVLNDPPGNLHGVPLELQRVVYRALAKDPLERYQSCSDLLQDLEQARAVLGAGSSLTGTSSRNRTATSELQASLAAASKSAWNPAASKRRWLPWGIAGVLVLLVIGGALSLQPVRESLRGIFWGSTSAKHIAVLPFDNIGNDPSNEAVSEGLMDSLTGRLSNLEEGQQSLWVVPASEVRRLKVTDPEAALRQLGATLVVKGSLQRDTSGVHLTLNLIRTKDVRQEGSLSLQDRTGDFSTLQDQAVSGLARLMHVELPSTALHNADVSSTPVAYESYLKALGYLQRYDKPGNLDLAISALSSAVTSDSQFALGYAGLGEAYRLKYQLDKNPKWTEQALANGSKATQLNDHLPAAYVTLGRIHDATGKSDLALQEFQRALALDPRNADALTGLAHAYEHAGRAADAESAYKKAIALRPDYWDGYNSLGNFYDGQGKYDDAVAQYKHAIELTPDNAQAYSNLGATYLDTGDPKKYGDAEAALKKSIELSPGYGAYANLGYLYHSQQRYAESAAAIEKALQFNDKDFIVWANLAAAYEGLNDKTKEQMALDRELPLLEQAAESNPRDSGVQSRLGLMYARKKLHDKALVRIQLALALSPDDPDVLENVGEAYEYLGDRQRAIQNIEKSLQKGYSMEALKSTAALQSLLSDPSFRPKTK